jgi:thiol-disulfide isomerase/thioredoxin
LKTKPKQKTPNWRLWLGGLIVIAVVAVIGLKTVQGKGTPANVAAASPTSAAGNELQAAVSALAVSSEDKMPDDPVGQLNWVQEHKHPALVIFRSTSCIPCMAMGKLIEQVRADYEPDVAFVTVLTDDASNVLLVRQAGIQAIPTSFFVGRDGQATKVLGAMEESDFRTQLEALRTRP